METQPIFLTDFLLTLDTHPTVYVKNAEVNQAGTKFGGQLFYDIIH